MLKWGAHLRLGTFIRVACPTKVSFQSLYEEHIYLQLRARAACRQCLQVWHGSIHVCMHMHAYRNAIHRCGCTHLRMCKDARMHKVPLPIRSPERHSEVIVLHDCLRLGPPMYIFGICPPVVTTPTTVNTRWNRKSDGEQSIIGDVVAVGSIA